MSFFVKSGGMGCVHAEGVVEMDGYEKCDHDVYMNHLDQSKDQYSQALSDREKKKHEIRLSVADSLAQLTGISAQEIILIMS